MPEIQSVPHLDDDDRATLVALLAEHDHATSEVARLSEADDRGSGERTARLASLGAWETEVARLVAQIAASTRGRDVQAARALLADG